MRRRGLTLLELLIATVVLALGVLGLLALIPPLREAGLRAETRVTNDQDARSIVAALRRGAREHTHVRWARGADGAPRVASVFVLFPHAAAASDPPPDPSQPQVFGDRGCLLLPFGSEKVLRYPRAGDAAAIARANGGGDVARAEEVLPDAGPPDALYRLYPDDPATAPARSAFALRIQRAERADGRPLDGLYRVTVLLYRGAGDDPRAYTLTEQLGLELAAGPSALDALAPSGVGLHPQDWGVASDATLSGPAANQGNGGGKR